MDDEQLNPQVEEETPVEEETTSDESQEEETIVLSKKDYNKLNHKASAYDSIKVVKKEKATPTTTSEPVDAVDLIKLGKKLQDYSDDELDFVTEYAKSKKPQDILKALENPFIKQGISAYRAEVEKQSLQVKPSGTQPEVDVPKSLQEKLAEARTIGDKQKILEEAGLYSEPKNNPNRVIIRQ